MPIITTMNSKKARFVRVETTEDVRKGLAYHGHIYKTYLLDENEEDNVGRPDIPVSQVFSEANGADRPSVTFFRNRDVRYKQS